MGKRGPAPKPTAIRRLEGNPSHRPLPTNEPMYPSVIPRKPKKLSTSAKTIWDELVAEMANIGILSSVDGRALASLCEDEALLENAYQGIWSMARSLKKEAKAQGKKIPSGEIVVLMAMKNGRMAMNALHHLSTRVIIERREFGLTPSARTRIMVDPDERLPNRDGAGVRQMDQLERALCGDL
jgi:P27 family predicted phage terminase small subunit